MYDYKARVLRWIDGDTVEVFIDQGFDDWTKEHIRLLKLWCPEIDDPGGPEAKARAEQLCPPDSMVYLDTRKSPVPIPIQNGRTFTRYLGHVYPIVQGGFSEPVSMTLVREGFGTEKEMS